MQKINFQNLPSTLTPINATNLNEIQNNVENVFNGSETMGNIVVGSIKTKNLFNKQTFVQGDITEAFPAIRISSRQNLWLDAGTYTFSTNQSSTYQYVIAVQNVSPPPISTQPTWSYDSGWQSGSSKTFTLSTGGYVCIYIRNANNTNVNVSEISSFNYQLEEGSTATAYTPYQELNNHEYYTTGEQAIGTWVNGKTLYRKVINIGNLPNATTKTISTGLSNITPINLYGYGYNPNTDVMFMVNNGNPAGLSFQIQAYYSSGSILIQTGVDRSAYSGYIVLEYTKN